MFLRILLNTILVWSTIPDIANASSKMSYTFCVGYETEEAKIEAWVNLQKAKAEAQATKLMVKIIII